MARVDTALLLYAKVERKYGPCCGERLKGTTCVCRVHFRLPLVGHCVHALYAELRVCARLSFLASGLCTQTTTLIVEDSDMLSELLRSCV